MVNQSSLPGQPEATRTLTPLQDEFLAKLTRFLKQRESYVHDPDRDPTLLKVLDRAIYVTYLDCLGQGLAELARTEVDQYRNRSIDNSPSTN